MWLGMVNVGDNIILCTIFENRSLPLAQSYLRGSVHVVGG